MYGKGAVEVLVDKTISKFNIDPSDLNIGSHKKVYVRCTRCEETFTREYRHKHQRHACPTHSVREDGTKLKWCNNCQMFLTYSCFSSNKARHDGLHSYCKTCAQTTPSSKKNTKKLNDSRKESLEGYMKWAASTKRSRCNKLGIEFDIDSDFLVELWHQQDGKCCYSNIGLEYGSKNLNSVWLERRDPSLGYTKENVVLASKMMNAAKNDASEEDFLDLLTHIKNDLFSIPVRLECKKLIPEARLPNRSRSTDAGYDLYSIEDAVVPSQLTKNIATGIALACPPGYYYTIEGRSSLGLKGIIPFRGIIDAGYTNQVWVILTNRSNEDYNIRKDDRIAQICLHRIEHIDITEIEDFSSPYSQRGEAGFGSSGK